MTELPAQLIEGEPLAFTLSLVGATGGTLHMRGPGAVDANATVAEGELSFNVSTTDLAAGLYAVEIWATLDGVNTLVYRGRFTLLESIASQADSTDQRSRAERIVDAIESYIERGADSPHRRYKINNREMERYGINELLRLLNYYKAQVAAESRKRSGRPRPRILFSL